MDNLQFIFDGVTTPNYLNGYSAYSKDLEAAWRALGGIPHQAKSWGFGTDPDYFSGQVVTQFESPYQIYSSSQAQTLSSLIDPNLAGGSQLYFFNQAQFTPFQVRDLNNRACLINKTCISFYCADTCQDIPPPSPPSEAFTHFGWVLPLFVLCYHMLN